jgi:hypothetical protein
VRKRTCEREAHTPGIGAANNSLGGWIVVRLVVFYPSDEHAPSSTKQQQQQRRATTHQFQWAKQPAEPEHCSLRSLQRVQSVSPQACALRPRRTDRLLLLLFLLLQLLLVALRQCSLLFAGLLALLAPGVLLVLSEKDVNATAGSLCLRTKRCFFRP